MDFLLWVNNVAKDLPLVGGALSVTLAGGILAALWKIPLWIWNIIKNTFTVTFVIDNAGWGPEVYNYISFLNWFTATDCWKWTRSSRLDAENDVEDGVLSGKGPGIGNHFLCYKGRFFLI